MRRVLFSVVVAGLLAACGGGVTPARGGTGVRQALMNLPELLEFEPAAVRQELYREVVRASQAEAGQLASSSVLFPISTGEALIAAQGLDLRTDLLQAPDAGTLPMTFASPSDRWSEDRREALQGLSEREVAELVARSLLTRWGIAPAGAIAVDRAMGAPYAAAYVDGILRINPAFLYLAAATGPSSAPATNQ